jgi:hypothetical protein
MRARYLPPRKVKESLLEPPRPLQIDFRKPSEPLISGFGRCSCCTDPLNEANLALNNEFLCKKCADRLYAGFKNLDEEMKEWF